jgi:serine/threonine-protein kinase
MDLGLGTRVGYLACVQRHDDALSPGARVGEKYRISRALGGGSMGTVYEALAPSGERVAVKTLFAASDDDGPSAAERRARFLREAAVCATVTHPNVVPVIDHGIDSAHNLPFLVMPLLEGEDLAALLDRVGRLAPEVAVAIVVQACEGLAAAHARGIVHRDVKPSNLFLARETSGPPTEDSRVVVKVTDFGLAKAHEIGGGATAGGKRGALTATGRFMGTPQYVSPEQAVSAKHVDVRSDVFSLAMSLYHALAGAPAFAYVRSFMGLVLEITSREAPPLQDVAPWVSPSLARIVHAALLREPEARCPSVSELALALDMAVGIDTSRRAIVLRSLSAWTSDGVAPRAELASSWSDLLRA